MIKCLLDDGEKSTVDLFQDLEPLLGRMSKNKDIIVPDGHINEDDNT